MTTLDSPREVPREIATTFESWRSQARLLRACHVMLLIAASVFSILTAAQVSGKASPYYAVAAALAVGILSALDLGVKANGFRNAWRHMNAAMARYHSEPEFTVEQLIQVYEAAETLIGDLPSGSRPLEKPGPSDQSKKWPLAGV
jgi:hypothetical protein